ncbi:MAG: cytochrome P450 [Halioglobus sp.]|jgi:cytochrome P450
MKKARSTRPVEFLPDINYWAVSKYDDIKTLLSDKDNYSAQITLEPLRP